MLKQDSQELLALTVDENELEKWGLIAPDAGGEPENSERELRASLHSGVHKVFVSAFAIMMTTYLITFQEAKYALFMVAISVVYVLVYFAVPTIMLRIQGEGKELKRESFGEFLERDFDNFTGTLTGWEATLQVCLIPVMLTICVIGMCITFALTG